jgi:hypothetical protein
LKAVRARVSAIRNTEKDSDAVMRSSSEQSGSGPHDRLRSLTDDCIGLRHGNQSRTERVSEKYPAIHVVDSAAGSQIDAL